ncbi:MAG: deoxyribodipyrimidine photolyase, partial [Armatimonadetes bacterium]|nr:deoxyribodipyrimidine photolyase [Armatimonadota bacterium]
MLKDRGWRGDGDFVVYWMHAARRLSFNYGLQRAVEVARDLGKPLVIVEELVCGQRWDNDRLHKFALDGMQEKLRRLRSTPVVYYPFAEQKPKQADRLAALLSKTACGIVTDDFPHVGLPDRADALAACCAVRVEAVDSNGLLPLQATERTFHTAASFRRFLQGTLLAHMDHTPVPAPLLRVRLPRLSALPEDITGRFPPASDKALSGDGASLSVLPIDHSVAPVETPGGEVAARRLLRDFVGRKLEQYAELRNHPDDDATSGLAPYLHYGHISAHEVFGAVAESEDWTPKMASGRRDGRRHWLAMSESAEAFLDQLITWRELGYNMAWHQADCDKYEALPEWARVTLDRHAAD